MKGSYSVPSSIALAVGQFFCGNSSTLSVLPKEDFVARWSALAYLKPGLHPDDYECEGSGWTEDLKPYAVEAWRRCEIGEISDEQIYCSYASWAGICDQLHLVTKDEKILRERITQGDF